MVFSNFEISFRIFLAVSQAYIKKKYFFRKPFNFKQSLFKCGVRIDSFDVSNTFSQVVSRSLLAFEILIL